MGGIVGVGVAGVVYRLLQEDGPLDRLRDLRILGADHGRAALVAVQIQEGQAVFFSVERDAAARRPGRRGHGASSFFSSASLRSFRSCAETLMAQFSIPPQNRISIQTYSQSIAMAMVDRLP